MQPVLARWSQYRFDEPVQARWSQYKPAGANIYKRKPVQVECQFEPVYARLSQCKPGKANISQVKPVRRVEPVEARWS
jgi:hypothetical protein